MDDNDIIKMYYLYGEAKMDLSYKELFLQRLLTEIHKSDRINNVADCFPDTEIIFFISSALLWTCRANRSYNLFQRFWDDRISQFIFATVPAFIHANKWYYYNRPLKLRLSRECIYSMRIRRSTFRRSTSGTALLNQLASVGSLYAQYHALIFHATYPLFRA